MSKLKISKATRLIAQECNTFLNTYLIEYKRRQPNTIKSYKDMFSVYFKFLKSERDKEIWKITVDDFSSENIILFMKWLNESNNNKNTTINKRLSELKTFCGYLCKNGHIDPLNYSKIQDITPMKTEKNQLKEELSIKQVHAILSQPNINKRKGRRDCCLMTILYDTGCRCDELLSLKLKDLRFNKDVCDIKILGKGRKYRATPQSKQATKILKTYLQEEKIIDNEQYLFSTNYNGFKHKMSADNVDRILSKYENELRTLGFEIPHLHPHLFRHTRAMHLYKNGVSLSLISQWLGHSNLETTLIYAYADTEMKRKAIDKAMNGKDMLYIEEEAKYSKEAIIKAMFGL